VNAIALAQRLGFDVEPWVGRGAELDEHAGVIRANTRARHVRLHGLIAHELGHHLLRIERADSEDGARYVAGALMLPRESFDRDLTRTAWSMPRLRALHVNASAQMIATRIVQLRDAVATIIDGKRITTRVHSPWIAPDDRLKRFTKWERELAARALEQGAEVRGDELCYAVPLVDGMHQRVIVVCELEQLSLRL
jgi:Zn-dependent peptidase ImmA (M78 family)